MSNEEAFACPRCRAESHNPRDLIEGYCRACHSLTREELVRFLRDRAIEDVTIAMLASKGGEWTYARADDVGAWALYDESWRIASLATYQFDDFSALAQAPGFRDPSYVDPDANGAHIERWQPKRVMVECWAKRMAIELLASSTSPLADELLVVLAQPWRDHHEFQPGWRR